MSFLTLFKPVYPKIGGKLFFNTSLLLGLVVASPVFLQAQEQTVPATTTEARLKVQGIEFEGNTLFTQEELEAVVGDLVYNEMTFSDVKEVATKVEDFYHEQGYRLAKVIIPQQNINQQGGMVKM